MKKNDLNLEKEELLILEGILAARTVQEFIWGELSTARSEKIDVLAWAKLFQKRCDKIKEINMGEPSAMVELRKRILQQAALSIHLLYLIEKTGI